jgi:DNA-binding transcriptional MocR family regulator
MHDSLKANIDGTLIEGVVREIRRRIAARILSPGAKLPSIRRFAEMTGVSKSTVVEAYDRLAAEGVIRPRHGSGFFVTSHSAPFSVAEIGPRLDRAVDPLWVSRQSLEAGDDVLKPGCGWLPAAWMPDEGPRRALRALARGEAGPRVDYDTPLGFAPLRQVLARRMAERGVVIDPEQIVLTESGTRAVDLICRLLIEPGDCVLVDDPCYFNFHALLRAHRAKLVSVPYTPSGPDLDAFRKILAEHRPRMYITNAALHNPTGATLSSLVAHRLLEIAKEHELTIIEDDIFADFEDEPARRLAALDGLDRVVHIGSFSKTLSAATRCGFIAARRDWIESLTDLKIALSFGASRFSAELVLRTLTDGTYRKHVENLRRRLCRAHVQTSERLKEIGIVPWIEPGAGMFLWCALPEGLDAVDVARRALAQNIVLAPGNVFSLSQSAGRFLRFNVAQCTSPRLFSALQSMMREVKQGI